jgi:hypothetical protein
MLGLLPLYFIGRAYYELAHEFDKNRWLFAILGVLSYYAGLYLSIFLIGIALAIVSPESVENIADWQATLMGLPFGVLACWSTYVLLKKSWSKPKEISKHTLDGDLVTPNPNRYSQDDRP